MRHALAILFTCAAMQAVGGAATFRSAGPDASAWSKIFAAAGITQSASGDTNIVIAEPDAPLNAGTAENRFLIVTGMDLARKIGIQVSSRTVLVRRIVDEHAPKMQIFWQQPQTLPVVEVPKDFHVFATDYAQTTPVMAGKRTTHGGILWLATDPGPTGIERYPYILQALADLGLTFSARTESLWAFFDSSYRIRADVDYLARRWREAGIAGLHVAAWHNMEPDPVQDAFLKRLIEACHRNGIVVYAWLELPHVSEKFWADHPEWREKTAAGQDAQLDWRKLMNLQNPDCRREASREILKMLGRFDWDGVNLAELYFESLEGASNPARFTPMNDDVRAEFKRFGGFDPKLLFDSSSPYAAAKNPEGLRKFLDYRAALATRMQAQWLDIVDRERASKPYLDVVLTHIDDRFEPDIRDNLGADVARSLPLIQARQSTLLVEDPATLWNLGPDRYGKLAQKYRELAPNSKNIAVDINVVERYQDVYPTKKQTGVELFELVHEAALSFDRVALYFENSLERQDLALLPVAASRAGVVTQQGSLKVNTPETVRIAWRGPAAVDGAAWPLQNATQVLVPAGEHTITRANSEPEVRLSDFNGEVRSAVLSPGVAEIAYTSRSRAIAVLDTPISEIEVDGVPRATARDGVAVMLPAGKHVAAFIR
jgi:hypothetical protein